MEDFRQGNHEEDAHLLHTHEHENQELYGAHESFVISERNSLGDPSHANISQMDFTAMRYPIDSFTQSNDANSTQQFDSPSSPSPSSSILLSDGSSSLNGPTDNDPQQGEQERVSTHFLQVLPQLQALLHEVRNTNRDSLSDELRRSSSVPTDMNNPIEAPRNRRGVRIAGGVFRGNNSTQDIHLDSSMNNGDVASENSNTQNQTGNRNDETEPTLGEEIGAILRRCSSVLPFLALLFLYFCYQHTTGIIVFVVGTGVIIGMDRKFRAQVAMKDNASTWTLLGIIITCLTDTIAICVVDGEINPLRHLGAQLESPKDTSFWDVIWFVAVNDFVVRLLSIVVKASAAMIRPDFILCTSWHRIRVLLSSLKARIHRTSNRNTTSTTNTSGGFVSVSIHDDDSTAAVVVPSIPTTSTIHRRKRKLYATIEVFSLLLRNFLASAPWYVYYQSCSNRFVGDIFAFSYIFIKAFFLHTQARQFLQLLHTCISLKLEFGAYASPEDLAEAGNPDCSICYESPMQVPVRLSCTHMFCEECVNEWFDRERSCPLCRSEVSSSSTAGGGSNGSSNSLRREERGEPKPMYLDGGTSMLPQLL